MELLAPAGNSEGFHAAVEAGADAVYLGTAGFNARLRARNFSTAALARLVPYAHRKGVRVYVALNTLVKQREFAPLADVLYQLEQIGVDAVIAADLGLIRLVRRVFPSLPLHGSTQQFVHNAAGLRVAKRLGMSRVILARELTLNELGVLSQTDERPELEVFVHGALCYSFSGLCLASSYLGGSSGNRGRCTQVCRRMFRSGKSRGTYFSLMDLSALELLPQLQSLGIASLKIEGRMKSATYVHTVVSMYRAALDTPERIPELMDEIDYDMGREKTSYFLGTSRQEGHISRRPLGGTGVYLGPALGSGSGSARVRTNHIVNAGDRIRVQPPDGREGIRVRVSHSEERGGLLHLTLAEPLTVADQSGIYLVDSRNRRPPLEGMGARLSSKIKLQQRFPRMAQVHKAVQLRPEKQSSRPPRPKLLVRIDRLAWLRHLTTRGHSGLVLGLEADEFDKLPSAGGRFVQDRSRVWLALPPFIAPGDETQWRKRVDRLTRAGFTQWFCASAGQREFFGPAHSLTADYPVWTVNGSSQRALHDLGFEQFCYSLEDDLLNMRACGSARGCAYLYARVPLFVSRAAPTARPGATLTDDRRARFTVVRRHGLYYLLADTPLCLTHRQEKFTQAGIRTFIVDLSFEQPGSRAVATVLSAYQRRVRLEGTSQVNFKGGLN